MVKHFTNVPVPLGWDQIKDELEKFDEMMREAENSSFKGKKKNEYLWPIYRINHLRSRFIYTKYYLDKEISRDLYEYCLDHGYGDKDLIAKWKKQGYEYLCCVNCISTYNTNYGTTCICRVPRDQLEEDGEDIECVNCGCNGCST
ncbi:G10 family [Cryptosporidium sp. chipmunk genotype I]|uniref:G10 family n=1 Tax=Cryptosporidium sp. chipmunk genotype I TaxID=1280935 RepID=UPI00351A9732|nr:G10 family [Cryptosporidium sp. chipmunk genotype I]